MVAASSPLDAASLVIFVFFSPNLFLTLCAHPLLAANGSMSLVSGGPLLKYSHRLKLSGATRWHQHTFCSCLPPTNLMPAPSQLSTYHASCSLRCDSKMNMDFFFLHNFTDRSFILTLDLSNFSILCFFLSFLFFIK